MQKVTCIVDSRTVLNVTRGEKSQKATNGQVFAGEILLTPISATIVSVSTEEAGLVIPLGVNFEATQRNYIISEVFVTPSFTLKQETIKVFKATGGLIALSFRLISALRTAKTAFIKETKGNHRQGNITNLISKGV